MRARALRMSPDLPRRVAILLHERDRRAETRPYVVWALRAEWERAGVEVVVLRGARAFVPADVVLNHVDLTTTPPAYAALLARYPLAVNGRCLDISKSRVSDLRVRPGDPWTGPVIVKTDANCGGKPERRLLGLPVARRVGASARRAAAALSGPRARERARWRLTTEIATEAYPVFDSLRDVPGGVFENPALVVERFLPEREGDLYALRTYYGLGDRFISRRVLSSRPIVKAAGVVRREEVEPHPGAVAAAAWSGLDYGKLDYVVHDGRAHVLDVNRTPTFGPRLDARGRRWTGEVLAAGLAALRAGARDGLPAGASAQAGGR